MTSKTVWMTECLPLLCIVLLLIWVPSFWMKGMWGWFWTTFTTLVS